MSSAVSWDVEEREERHPALRIRKGLVDRGRRRSAPRPPGVGGNAYWVRGEDRFNDTRDAYLVRWDGEAGQWHCTCMEGVGGEYRTRGCSHVGAVVVEITERDGVDPWGLRAPYEPTARRSTVVPVAEPGTVPGPGDPFWGSLPWPEWVRGFRPHQEQAFLEIVDAFKSGKKVVVLDAPTGCLAGDTEIVVNRAGKSFRLPIAELVHKFNGGGSDGGYGERHWDPEIPTRVQRATIAPKYGFAIKGVELVRAISSGVKATYTLTIESGRSIRATADHRFMLDGGGMVPLKDLQVGDLVLVDGGKGKGGPAPKPWYRVVQGLVNHPHRGEWPYRQPEHRLVVEAHLNDLPLDWYIAILRDSGADVGELRFLDPAQHVHHRNHDPQDNRRENLEVLDRSAHLSHHGTSGQWAHVANRVVPDRVTSIEEFGEEETYDLTVLGEPHNFVANGFVVENSGKTLLAEMVRRGLKSPRMNFTCTTRSLQEQVLKDFGYARMLQGRANYPTANYPHLFKAGDWAGTNCGDCEMATPEDDCSLCPGVGDCPYTIAKMQATTAPVAVLNSAYVLREWMGQRSRFRDAGLTVMDEADELESALMGLVEVSISPRQQERLGMKPPVKKTVESSWIEWTQEAIPQVRAMTAALRAHAKDNVRARRDLKHYEGLLTNLKLMAEELGQGLWVYDGGTKPGDWIRFKPVKVDRYGRQFIWDNDERFLLMSASVVSAQHMAESLGLLDDEWVEVHVPSTFPPENRPVYPLRIANVVASNKDAAYPAIADAISGILDMHPDERVLVHTVSYDLTRFLFERLWGGVDTDRRPVFAYMAAADRQQALSNYIAKERAVLLAPSFERGIDLPDELCRVMVIAKVPYPNLGDKQVSARLHTKGGELWYRVATVRSIVQMTGRGVRHAQDQAVTYVLDSQFLDNVWKRSRLLLPKWWREALVTDVGAIARRIKRGR